MNTSSFVYFNNLWSGTRIHIRIKGEFQYTLNKPDDILDGLFDYLKKRHDQTVPVITLEQDWEERDYYICLENSNVSDIQLFNNYINEYFKSSLFLDTQRISPKSLVKIIKNKLDYDAYFSSKAYVYWFLAHNAKSQDFDMIYTRVQEILDRY
jgi:hypothetical protein